MKRIILILITCITISGYAQETCTNCNNTQTNGSTASAIGYGTKANGNYSFASGYLSEALGVSSTALGTNAIATNVEAVAIGSYANANADGSFAIGRLVEVSPSATTAMVIGMGVGQNLKLVNNSVNSLMIGFNSTKPTLFINPAPTNPAYNRTGKVAIGNVDNGFGFIVPQAKLHIRADNEEDASLFVEPHRWDEHAQANMLLGNIYHGITADGTAGLVFRTQSAYIFNEGNVGIGTSENLPETKLDVIGTVKMTGLRLQNQGAQTGYVLTCSGLNGQATWQDPSGFSVWSVNERNEAYRMSKVGIGVENPEEMLDVAGNILVNDAIIGKITQSDWVDPDFLTILGSVDELGSANVNASKIMIPKGNNLDHLGLKIINPALNGDIQFHAGGHYNAVLRNNEFIVGFPGREVDLKVNGKIEANHIRVSTDQWWDEVFEPNYKLRSIEELNNYIIENKHLPDMPDKQQVEQKGIDVGEMNALLLKKIEELTLYVIELKKENKEMKKEMEIKLRD